MIKSLVGRLAGKGNTAPDSKPAPAAPQQAPRKDTGRGTPAPEQKAQGSAGSGKSGSKRRRRSRGKSPQQQPAWSVDQFQVEPKVIMLGPAPAGMVVKSRW